MKKQKYTYTLLLIIYSILYTSNIFAQEKIEKRKAFGFHLGIAYNFMSFTKPIDNYKINNNGVGYMAGTNVEVKLNSRNDIVINTGLLFSPNKIINLNDDNSETNRKIEFFYLSPDYSFKLTNKTNNNLHLLLGLRGDYEIINKIIYLGGGMGLEIKHKSQFFKTSYIIKYYYSKSSFGNSFGSPISINGIALSIKFS